MTESPLYDDIELEEFTQTAIEEELDGWTQGESDFREMGEVSLSFSLNNPDERREYALLMTDLKYFRQPHQKDLNESTNQVTIGMPRKVALQMEVGPYRKAVEDVLGAEDILSEEEENA